MPGAVGHFAKNSPRTLVGISDRPCQTSWPGASCQQANEAVNTEQFVPVSNSACAWPALSDEELEVIEAFGQERSPIRILIASDMASEGLNLHFQCHRLIHFDLPWSLLRFQQRNGRIDRGHHAFVRRFDAQCQYDLKA